MIFISKGITDPIFADTYDYVNGDEKSKGDTITWNLSTFDPNDRQTILQDFSENAQMLRKRADWNVFYHEKLSLPRRSDHNLETLQSALYDMSVYWLERRAPGLLAYGRAHIEATHIHMHLIISSNEVMTAERYRIEKDEFNEIKPDCERYINQKYPELKLQKLHQKEPGKKLSKAQQVELDLTRILEEPMTHLSASIEQRLKRAGYEMYLRGDSHGVKTQSGMTYRFTRFGLADKFAMIREAEAQLEARKKELQAHVERVMPDDLELVEQMPTF